MKKLTIFFFTVLIATQVEADFNFALHTDSHPWAREDPKGAQEEIDTLIKIIRPYNDLLVSCSWFMIKSEEIS